MNRGSSGGGGNSTVLLVNNNPIKLSLGTRQQRQVIKSSPNILSRSQLQHGSSKSEVKQEFMEEEYFIAENDDDTAELLTPQVTIMDEVPSSSDDISPINNKLAQESEPQQQQQQRPSRKMSTKSINNSQDEVSFGLDDILNSSLNEGRGARVKRPSSISSSGSNSRPKKMYELDVNIYPEAAAARASYENRLRKKAEKEEMINTLNFLTERNKVLEEENAALKEKLLEYELNVSAQDWLIFFRNAGIRNNIEKKYAEIFDENRIKPNMLLDLNEQWLRDMNITAVGDILAILKHAKIVHQKTNGKRLHYHVHLSKGNQGSIGNGVYKNQSPAKEKRGDDLMITEVRSLK